MRIIAYDQDPAHAARAVDFKIRTAMERPGALPPTRSRESHLYSAENLFLRHGRIKNFLAEANGEVVGIVSAITDDQLPRETGLVGFFECVDQGDVAARLLDSATTWLRAAGCTWCTGPVDGNIWVRYRFKTRGFELQPHWSEPANPAFYPALWEASGFSKGTTWRSYDIPRARLEPLFRSTDAKANAPDGWRYERWTASTKRDYSADLHRLMVSAWAENELATPIDFPEFVSTYGFLVYILDVVHIGFHFDRDGAARGIGFATPDFGPSLIDAGGDDIGLEAIAAAAQASTTYVLHQIAIDPACRGHHLVDMALRSALSSHPGPYANYIGYMAKSPRTVFDRVAAPTREYALFTRTLI